MAPSRAAPGSAEARVRPAAVILAVVIAGAFGGFAIGTTDDAARPAPRGEPRHPAAAAAVRPAPTYRGQRERPPAATGAWAGDRAAMEALLPALTDEVALEGTDKAAVLADRGARRAFDGAPPTIPHPVRQDSALECLACHERGLAIRGRVAPPVPHDPFTSCVQCHVVEAAPMAPADWLAEGWPAASGFSGRGSPEGGDRWWGDAPPEIPHRTFMREDCRACHGPAGRDAIRSSHPWRETCTQCHAPSAVLDQRLVE